MEPPLGLSPLTNSRRSERTARRFPVTLLAKSRGLEYTQPASTLDVSAHGFRVRTDEPMNPSRPIEPGQVVYLYGVENARLGYCRVVWVRTQKPEFPSEAGLELLGI